MIARLFWKEFHERAPWFALWTLAVVVLAALGIGQGFTMSENVSSNWLNLPPVLALLAGLMGYGSELKGERATFLYSRALLWKPLLFVKITTGLLVTVVAVALGALTCRLVTPAAYLPFVTWNSLLNGAKPVLGFTGVAYLAGLCCSVALPGLAGGIIILLLYFGIWMVFGYTESMLSGSNFTPYFTAGGMLAAPLIGLFITARFGLTLPPLYRTTRFVLLLAGIVLAGFLLNRIPALWRIGVQKTPVSYFSGRISVSPSGNTALLDQSRGSYVQMLLIDTKSGKRGEIQQPGYSETRWLQSDVLLLNNYQAETALLAYLNNGHAITIPFSLNRKSYELTDMQFLLSPDGNRLLAVGWADLYLIDLQAQKVQQLFSYDTRNAKTSSFTPVRWHTWWQNNHTIAFLHPVTGKRTLISVK